MKPILDLSTAKVAVELTNRCNLHCGMCPLPNLTRPSADMPWELVQKVAADLRDNGVQVSWLHEMGEPLLSPRLAEAIELFPGCSVSTNAVALSQRKAAQCNACASAAAIPCNAMLRQVQKHILLQCKCLCNCNAVHLLRDTCTTLTCANS